MSPSKLDTRPDVALPAVYGTVEHGDHLGRQLGFPTANVYVPDAIDLPTDGVFAAWLTLADGTALPGAASLGVRPTVVRDGARLLEVHVLDVDGWIDLYDEQVSVQLVERIRGQIRFAGLPQLIAQIGRDCDAARRILRN